METIFSRPRRPLPPDSVIRDRLARVNVLTPDQIEAGLAFLAGCDDHTFNSIVGAAEAWDDGGTLAAARAS